MIPAGYLLGLLALQGLGFLILYRVLDKRLTEKSDVSGALDAIRAEVTQLLAELNNTADRNITVLEDRVLRLRQLVNTADKRLTTLGTEVDRHASTQQTYSHLARSSVPDLNRIVPPEPYVEPDSMTQSEPPVRERVVTLHRSGLAPASIANRLGVSVGEVELVISLESRGQVEG